MHIKYAKEVVAILILVVAVLLFGTKKIRNIGEDLGAAVKSFRKGMKEDDVKEQAEK